mgnify:CR=1 FL=1
MDQQDEVDGLRERVGELEHQLEAVQAELQVAANRDVPLLKGTVRGMLHEEIETTDELPPAGRAFGQRIAERRERLEQLEARLEMLTHHTNTSTKAEKITAVLTFAQNKANGSGKVAVTPAEIRGCTGVSRRYAYDLVDAIADDVPGVQVRESTQVKTTKGTKRKQKALLVDCEEVHGLDEAVNSFTTPTGGDGEA